MARQNSQNDSSETLCMPPQKASGTAMILQLSDQHLACKEIYEERRNHVLARIKSLGLNESEAEDIVQEAFVRLLRTDIKDKTSYLRAYLFKIATNLAIDHLRRNKRNPVVEDKGIEIEQHVDGRLTPEELTNYHKLLNQVGETLKELPDKCRTAFLLYKVKEFEYREVASHLNISESMVRKYVIRAMRHCYMRLQGHL